MFQKIIGITLVSTSIFFLIQAYLRKKMKTDPLTDMEAMRAQNAFMSAFLFCALILRRIRRAEADPFVVRLALRF